MVVVSRSAGAGATDVGGVALGQLERRGDPVNDRLARLLRDARASQQRRE